MEYKVIIRHSNKQLFGKSNLYLQSNCIFFYPSPFVNLTFESIKIGTLPTVTVIKLPSLNSNKKLKEYKVIIRHYIHSITLKI